MFSIKQFRVKAQLISGHSCQLLMVLLPSSPASPSHTDQPSVTPSFIHSLAHSKTLSMPGPGLDMRTNEMPAPLLQTHMAKDSL